MKCLKIALILYIIIVTTTVQNNSITDGVTNTENTTITNVENSTIPNEMNLLEGKGFLGLLSPETILQRIKSFCNEYDFEGNGLS